MRLVSTGRSSPLWIFVHRTRHFSEPIARRIDPEFEKARLVDGPEDFS